MSSQILERRAQIPAVHIMIRPSTDLRRAPSGFTAALAAQLARAEAEAEGRVCVSVPAAAEQDDIEALLEALLRAAAAHREAATGEAVQVQVSGIHRGKDGFAHLLAQCVSGQQAVHDHQPGRPEAPAAGE